MFSKLGGGGKPEEEKTVTAGTSVIEVLPSSGKTMKKVTVNPTPSQSKTVTPSTSQQTVSPDSGKLLSSVDVEGDSDLIPENIREGIDIFGVLGTLSQSIENAIKSMGFTKACSGTVTPSYGKTITINHNLGVTPKFVFIKKKAAVNQSLYDCLLWYERLSSYCLYAYHAYNMYKAGARASGTTVNSTKFVYTFDDSIYFQYEYEYLILA